MIVLVKRKQATNIKLSVPVVGDLDGLNKTFTTPSDYKSGKISLLCNGQALHSPADFTETGSNEITFVHFAPADNYILRATYEEA